MQFWFISKSYVDVNSISTKLIQSSILLINCCHIINIYTNLILNISKKLYYIVKTIFILNDNFHNNIMKNKNVILQKISLGL